MILVKLLVSIAFCSVASQGCANPTVRPAWRTLAEPQRQAYLTAIKALKQRAPGNATGDMANWNYDQFVQCHWDNIPQAHCIAV
jgi:hypothetical protein